MLQTNLSTRPFYNERAIHLGIALLGLLVLVASAFNVTQVVALSGLQSELQRQIDQDESRARDLVRQADGIRASINDAELEVVTSAAREANRLIEGRTFSWTELFNRIESTIPPGVMLAAVTPSIDDRGVSVTMVVVGRRVEDIDQFMEQLEATGAFRRVLPREERVTEEGMFRATLAADYRPRAEGAEGAESAAVVGIEGPRIAGVARSGQ